VTCTAHLNAGNAKGRLVEIFRKTGEANRAARTPAATRQTTPISQWKSGVRICDVDCDLTRGDILG